MTEKNYRKLYRIFFIFLLSMSHISYSSQAARQNAYNSIRAGMSGIRKFLGIIYTHERDKAIADTPDLEKTDITWLTSIRTFKLLDAAGEITEKALVNAPTWYFQHEQGKRDQKHKDEQLVIQRKIEAKNTYLALRDGAPAEKINLLNQKIESVGDYLNGNKVEDTQHYLKRGSSCFESEAGKKLNDAFNDFMVETDPNKLFKDVHSFAQCETKFERTRARYDTLSKAIEEKIYDVTELNNLPKDDTIYINTVIIPDAQERVKTNSRLALHKAKSEFLTKKQIDDAMFKKFELNIQKELRDIDEVSDKAITQTSVHIDYLEKKDLQKKTYISQIIFSIKREIWNESNLRKAASVAATLGSVAIIAKCFGLIGNKNP